MDEIERKKAILTKYEIALTKLDALDPETKNLVLEAIRRTMFEIRNEISMIERNRSMSYIPEEKESLTSSYLYSLSFLKLTPILSPQE